MDEEHVQHYGGYLICESATTDNARLIAAAPDLKDSLKWALEALEASDLATWPDSIGWDAGAYKIGLQQAKDAIAKAEPQAVDRG